jgi:NAD(P)-dependent dehydrogenase (short-subunit alcohol dehydrogenase family)
MRHAVITGANRGIGLELADQLASSGWNVTGMCRTSSPRLDSIAQSVWQDIDVTEDGLEVALRDAAGEQPIDLLINCAGILTREDLEELHIGAIRKQFEVNSLGPLRTTHALLPNLREGSKVIVITSRMGSIADNTSGARYGYRMSKAAVNMAFVSLAHDLRPRGVAVGILHPGFVRTDMTAGRGNWNADEAAAALLEQIDALDLGTSGAFRHANGEVLPW